MGGKYVLHTFFELMLDPGMERDLPCWKHKPFESFEEAFKVLIWKDHRAFFRDVGWNSGQMWLAIRGSITSPRGELMAVRYSLEHNYGREFPAGVYLYFNPTVVSFKQLEDRGLYLSCYKRIGEQGETILLATKQQLEKKVPMIDLFNNNHKRVKYHHEVGPKKMNYPRRR